MGKGNGCGSVFALFFCISLFTKVPTLLSGYMGRHTSEMVFGILFGVIILYGLFLSITSMFDRRNAREKELLQSGDMEKIIDYLKKKANVSRTPENNRYLLMLLTTYYRSGYFEDYKDLYLKIKDFQINLADYIMGRIYQIEGRFDESISYLLNGSESVDQRELLMQLSYSYFNIEEYDKSLKCLFECLNLNGEKSIVYFCIARVYEQLENIEEAFKFYRFVFEHRDIIQDQSIVTYAEEFLNANQTD